MHQSEHDAPPGGVSRRDLFRLGLGAATVVGLGAGCTSGKVSSSSTEPATLPKHIPARTFDGVIKSDVPGVPLGYTTYPHSLVKTVDEVPGRGGEVTSLTMTWGGQPTPYGRNKFWQGLNKRLGVDWKPTIASADGYEQKLATILAGGDLPDLTILRPCAAANTALRQGAFANLNDALGGNGIEKYPNIGWTRPEQWKQVLVNGGIFGVPLDVPICNQEVRIRTDWVHKLGFDHAPANAEEFHAFLTALPKSDVAGKGTKAFGLATFSGGGNGAINPGGNAFINQMFKVPNQWRQEGDKLVHMYETDEFAEALKFAVQLWKDGGFHPDALAISQQIQKELALFTGGQTPILSISMIGWYQKPYVDTVKASDGQIVPYVLPGHDGKGATYYLGGSVYGLCGISAKAAKDEKRLAELLRIVNWLKAPFASAENTYIMYGQQGVYWHWKDGDPTYFDQNKQQTDAGTLCYGYRPNVWYVSGQPNAAKEMIDYSEKAVRAGMPNPCDGLASQVADRVTPVLTDLANNHLNQILTGRRPMTDLKTFLSEWRSRGGDDMRNDFRKQLAARGHG